MELWILICSIGGDGTKGITWDKNMEDEFWEFMLGMLQFIPKKMEESRSSLEL
jgi:hypothetical protein